MTNITTKVIKFLIFVLFILGCGLLLKSKYQKQIVQTENQTLNSKSLILKKYLLKFEKPQRIELTGLSNRFEKEIIELKKLKVAQNANSDFYITIQLFTDETDATAPLIAQIRFIDLKSGNSKKEESINLE